MSVKPVRFIFISCLLCIAPLMKLVAQPVIQYPEESLAKRLEKISGDFNIHISYDQLQVENINAEKLSINTTNAEQVLKYSLRGTGFRFHKHKTANYYIMRAAKGTVTGLIIDAEDGTPLPGVSVQVGNNVFASTESGVFHISLQEDAYDMVLSSVGYSTKQISNVEVQAGRALYLNITLQRSGQILKPARVVSSVATESLRAHYVRQKQAGVVTDGLAATQIESLPDKPLSQVIKRINGVNSIGNTIGIRGLSERNSQVLIDGIALPSVGLNKRGLALDIFPKEIISAIVLTKTAAPDAPAAFSGGQINIHTLGVPNRSFTSLSFETGINSQSFFKTAHLTGQKGNLDWLGLDDGTRKKPANIKSWQWYDDMPQPPPGHSAGNHTLIPGETDLYNSLNAVEQSKTIPVRGLKPSQQTVLPDFNFNFSVGRSYALNDSMALSFVWGTSVYQRQSIARYNNLRRSVEYTVQGDLGEGMLYQSLSGTGTVFNIGFKMPALNLTLKNMLSTQLKDNFSAVTRTYENKGRPRIFKEQFRDPEQFLLQQHQLTIQKNFAGNISVDYNMAFTNAVQKLLDRRYFQYFLTSGVADGAVYNTPNILYNWKQNNDSNVVDNRTWMDAAEKIYTTGLSFSKGLYRAKGFSGMVKAGWSADIRRKNVSMLRLLPYSTSGQELTGQYHELLDPAGNSPVFYWPENTNGNIYSGKMNNHAFYILTDQKLWNRLQLLYGLRAEYYTMQNDQQVFLRRRYRGTIPSQYGNGTTGEKNWQLLPSANAIFSITSKINARAAWSKTVLRPDFRELAYFGLYEYDLDGYISGRQLFATSINNYDVRFEWYPSPEENISLSLFHKDLKYPVELAQAAAFPSSYGYVNQRAARTSGIELEARKSLKFLAPKSFLNRLTIHANYTTNWSKVEIGDSPFFISEAANPQKGPYPQKTQERPLFNQAPWVLNLGLLYNAQRAGFFAFYNKSGPKAYITHINPNYIEYENGMDQLDISAYIKCLKGKARVTLNALNILDQWRIYYINKTAYQQINGDGWQLVNGTAGYNAKEGDVVTYRIKQGVNASISFTLML